MALSIKNPEPGRLASEMAPATAATRTEPTTRALHDRLVRETGRAGTER